MDYKKACEILEVKDSDDLEAIKNAYRARIKFYHPDQYQENEEKRRYAEEKTKQINDAWDYIQENYHNRDRLSGADSNTTQNSANIQLENPLYRAIFTVPAVVLSIIALSLFSTFVLERFVQQVAIENYWGYSKRDAALLQDFEFSEAPEGYAIRGARTNLVGKVEIPGVFDGEPVTVIEENAFADCVNITEIIIPSEITTIKSGAFSNCDQLKTVVIPDTVVELEDVTFVFPGVFDGCDNLEIVYVGKGITALTYSTFAQCTALKEIHISDSIKLIEAYTFIGCPSVEKIYFNGTIEQWKAVQVAEDAFGRDLIIEIHCTDGIAQLSAK